MNALAVAALVFALAFVISMAVAGIIYVLFLGIQASQRRAAAASAAADADPDMPMLGGDGGVAS